MTIQRKWIIHILLPCELYAQAPLVLTNYASKLYNTAEILELELKFCTPQHRLNFTKFYTDSETEALLNCSLDKYFPQWKMTHCCCQIITFPHLNTPLCRQPNNSQKRKVPALISWWRQLFYTFSTRDCVESYGCTAIYLRLFSTKAIPVLNFSCIYSIYRTINQTWCHIVHQASFQQPQLLTESIWFLELRYSIGWKILMEQIHCYFVILLRTNRKFNVTWKPTFIETHLKAMSVNAWIIYQTLKAQELELSTFIIVTQSFQAAVAVRSYNLWKQTTGDTCICESEKMYWILSPNHKTFLSRKTMCNCAVENKFF